MTTAEQFRQVRGRLINRLKRQQNQLIELADRVRTLEGEVGRLRARAAAPSPAEAKAAQLETRLNAWSPQTFSSSLLLGKGSKFGDRVVGPHGFDKLVNQVVDLTGADPAAARRHLQVAYRSVILAEARSLGRIAGSTLNILGKLVTPRLLAPPNSRVLEIGTLFGVFGGALAHELSRDGGHVELTVVDPLEGVQLQGGHVPTTDVSGTPVSEPVVRHNLEAAGLREPGFRIVEGYSTDEAVRQEVGDRTYGLIIVDGDHSEQGVKADLEWVESLVEPGTIVVLDDYGDARWPGVQAATDKHLIHSQELSMAGLVSTSAYLIAGTGSASSSTDSEQRRAPAQAPPARARLRAPREKTAALPAPQLPIGTAQASTFFDEYPLFGKRKRKMNLRHEAIIRQNADVLRGSHVLDLACSEGAWSFAALDAGAVHVIGIESRKDKVENARAHFAEYGVQEDRYRFVAGDVFEVLARDQPRADVVLCLGFLYHTLRYPELIHHIRATGAHTLIIDTEVAVADGPFVRLLADNADMIGNASADRYSVNNTVLTGRPTLEGLQKMVNVYGFAIERRSDWAAILRDNPGSESEMYAAGRRVTVMCRRGDEMTWRDGDSRR